MRIFESTRDTAARFARWAFSAPIFIKIFGIGFLVTVLFGTVAFYQIRVGMFRTHYQVHGETALSVALSLSSRIEPLIRAQDKTALNNEVNQTIAAFPDIRYIIVQDRDGKIISHGFTFPKEAPPDLLKHQGDLCGSCHASLPAIEVPSYLVEVPPKLVLPTGRVRAYTRTGGMILEVTVPLGGSQLGNLRLGVGDKVIAREIASISRSLLWSLALCLVVGLSLALGLAYILVQPVHNLVQATNRIRQGDFHARAGVFSQDEIGKLAVAFNQMADGLESYRKEVQEKEAARVSLIGQIVQVQEEERKSVARELHDQLGQSLSNALLMVESHYNDCPHNDQCKQITDTIRGLIDEVRQLAWDVRPSILDDYGLDSALARYVEETSKRCGLPIDYQSAFPPGFGRLPARIEVTLYRIAQEGVTNIIRHAQATQASAILMCHDHEISLIIEDNGCGFDVARVERGSAPPLGLIGMQERAALVGGEIAVDSQPEKGTIVRIRIPLDKKEETK